MPERNSPGPVPLGQKLGIDWAPGAGDVVALPWPEKSKAGTGGRVGSGLSHRHVVGLCVTPIASAHLRHADVGTGSGKEDRAWGHPETASAHGW